MSEQYKSSSINGASFANILAEVSGCSVKEAKKRTQDFTRAMTTAICSSERVSFVNFGKFTVTRIPAHLGHHPKTGEEIITKAYYKMKFTPSPEMKRCLFDAWEPVYLGIPQELT